MNIILRTALFHILCIFLFAMIYHCLDEFELNNIKKRNEFIDYLSLSTTIQCGVGFSNMFPTSVHAKLATISQQFLMILTHIITLYIFTI